MSTHNIYFHDKIRNFLLSQIRYSYLQLWKKILGIQERVRNSHGKRVIGVRAIEVSVYHYSRYQELRVHVSVK